MQRTSARHAGHLYIEELWKEGELQHHGAISSRHDASFSQRRRRREPRGGRTRDRNNTQGKSFVYVTY